MADPEGLGASIFTAFEQWTAGLPAAVLQGFGQDRVRLLCGALLVPAIQARPWGGPGVIVTIHPPGERLLGITCAPDLILAASIVLVVRYLDDHGREAPEEVRAAASIAMMLGLVVQ